MQVGFGQGQSPPNRINGQRRRDAVLWQFGILGEAVKRLSPGFRAAHPEIPWKKMANFRDFLFHHYDEVRVEKVWEAIETLAQLAPMLRKLVQSVADTSLNS